MKHGLTIAERFYPKVGTPLENGCHPWMAATSKTGGYGIFLKEGQTIKAHRIAWELEHGPVPDGLCVLHRCDNRICVNVEHLFLGTKADNNHDRYAKSRGWRLNRENAEEIRRLYASGINQPELAKRFGVKENAISRIVNHQRWGESGKEVKPGYRKGNRHGMSKLTETEVKSIRSRRDAGEQIRTLAAEYQVAESCISKIVHRKLWAHLQ